MQGRLFFAALTRRSSRCSARWAPARRRGPCGRPPRLLHSWPSSAGACQLDRAQLGADGFELAISAASIGERDPAVYQIDVWGRFSLLAVQVENLARLPLVINSCITRKMQELPWTD